MSPLGHLSIAYLAGSRFRKANLGGLICGAILPDIDFLFLPFSFFNNIHRVVTHNLLFIVAGSLFIGAFFTGHRRFYIIGSLLIGGLLHLFIDACMDMNLTNGIGVPFFWPFDATFYSPVNFITPVETSTGWNDPLAMIKLSFPGMVYEIPFAILAAIVLIKKHGIGFKNRT